jgi:hypothetical protein
MSDLRPAAQWPDSGARAVAVSLMFPALDPASGVWGWSTRGDGALEADENGVYAINPGSRVHTVRATKKAGSKVLTKKIL